MTPPRFPKDRDERDTTSPEPGSDAERARNEPAALVPRKPTNEANPITGRTRIITKDDLRKSAVVAQRILDEPSRPNASSYDKLHQEAHKARAAGTLAATEAGQLRIEVKEDMRILRTELTGSVDELRSDLTKFGLEFAEMKGGVQQLVKNSEEDRAEKRLVVTTELKIRETEAAAEQQIRERKETAQVEQQTLTNATRNAMWMKIVTAITSVGFVGMVLAHLKGCP